MHAEEAFGILLCVFLLNDTGCLDFGARLILAWDDLQRLYTQGEL
jgi:hypothetical protein